jgi:hypothetical protein
MEARLADDISGQSMTVAFGLVALIKAWLVTGAVVALAFLWRGLRSDPAARGAYSFRLVILPGLILLWPLVVWRWAAPLRSGAEPKLKSQHAAHGVIWLCIAAILATAFILMALNRSVKLPDQPSQRLSVLDETFSGPDTHRRASA